MGILKEFLGYNNKTIDDMIMDLTHTMGIILVDSSSFKWLEKQEGITKLKGLDLIDLRFHINPWLFNQVNMLFLGYYGFSSNLEEDLICYQTEDGLMFFTVDSMEGSYGYYVILCPVIDVKKESQVTHEKREDDPA